MSARNALAARRVRRRRKSRITEDHVFAPVATDYKKKLRGPMAPRRRKRRKSLESYRPHRGPSDVMYRPRDLA